LLVLVLVLLALLRPELGAYPGWAYPLVHLLWFFATFLFGTGSFQTIVGAADDTTFRAMRTAIGAVLGIGTTLVLALGAFLLQSAMSYERTEQDRESSSSWDDD